MRFQKILCPVDFSPPSQQALETAARLAKSMHAELVIAHAWYVPPLPTEAEYPMPVGMTDELVDENKRALAAAAERATELGAPKVSTRFLTGVPWDRLVALLHDDPRFDLVVMNTYGRSGVPHILLGSVTERVIRHAPCPVLVTRGSKIGPFQKVLCPVDFSASSRSAVELASQLVDPHGALHLLYVIELPVSYDHRQCMTEFVRDLDARSTRLVDELAAAVRAKTTAIVSSEIRVGTHAGAQILSALGNDHYDLVVTGSHGRTGLKRALLGSVAEKVARQATCSAIVVRGRD